MNLNEFIDLQEELGLTNEQIANWLNVKERQISRWRNEYEAPRSAILALKYRLKYGVILYEGETDNSQTKE